MTLSMPAGLLLFLGLLAFNASAQSFFSSLLPSPTYQQHLFYPPAGAGQIQGQLHFAGNPVSVDAGFHLNPPHLPRFPNIFEPFGRPFFRPPQPIPQNIRADKLFTPNFVAQPAESAGQVEMYHKALAEQNRDSAEQTTEFLDSDKVTSYVNVDIQGANYKYTT